MREAVDLTMEEFPAFCHEKGMKCTVLRMAMFSALRERRPPLGGRNLGAREADAADGDARFGLSDSERILRAWTSGAPRRIVRGAVRHVHGTARALRVRALRERDGLSASDGIRPAGGHPGRAAPLGALRERFSDGRGMRSPVGSG